MKMMTTERERERERECEREREREFDRLTRFLLERWFPGHNC
jgi:hypothetical protein